MNPKKSIEIKSVRERERAEMGFSITRSGGARDGEEFRMVELTMSDETKRWVFVSNARPGYFKHVFVPWDFDHPEIVDG